MSILDFATHGMFKLFFSLNLFNDKYRWVLLNICLIIGFLIFNYLKIIYKYENIKENIIIIILFKLKID